MYNKLVISVVLSILSISCFSQCIPNSVYQDSLPNIWPSSGFPNATVGVNYSQIWTMKTPVNLLEAALGDSSAVTIDTLGQSIYIGDWIVDSVVTIDILNTPPGMSVDCNTPNCSFPGNVVACADINGIPTTADWYNLQIISNLYSHGVVTVDVGGVPLTLPASINYYEQTGSYDTVSRYIITVNQASSINHINSDIKITNIISENNTIYFGIYSNLSSTFHLNITDILGRKVYQTNIETTIGRNEYSFNNQLEKGIYVISLKSKTINFSQKVHLSSNQ